MNKKPELILASASPNRLDLLRSIGLEPDEISPADIDETPHKDELPKNHVLRLAQSKASKVAETHKGNFIIAADTIGYLGRKIIGKAKDENEARKILSMLSGRRHKVYSGLCVIAPDGRKRSRCIITIVKFKKLERDELEEYLKSGQWKGKSGCYGIQSRAGGFIEWINGSFSNVVGLPLAETRKLLCGLGYKF